LLLALLSGRGLPVQAQTPPAAAAEAEAEAATADEDLRVYTDAPRLFLRPQRLRTLRRERQRESIRWQQLDALISGKVPMVEHGMAMALYAKVAERPDLCREAERGAGTDVRQMAIVYDWCQTPALAPRLKAAADKLAGSTEVPQVRSRALAAIALAEADPAWSEAVLRDIIQRWWRTLMAPKIRKGAPFPREHTLALMELLHAVRDNLNLDLRDPVQGFFRDLPVWHMLSYYPAAYPAAENEYRIPYYQTDGEPDLRLAQLSRAAELAMVAYDSNAVENQGLQSWLLQDRYLMRGTLGIVYEFLWANPYQPGITYHFLPNVFHDRPNGRLFIRSSWEEEATFFCYDKGVGQVFEAGKRADVNVAAQSKPIRIGSASVIPGKGTLRFETGHTAGTPTEPGEKALEESWFVVGVKPNARFNVEPDDEEMFEVRSDGGGILSFQYPKPRKMTVRLKETP
jgi:hypothetical protein